MPEMHLTIRPLRDETEARHCAAFLVASEPWITLGMTFAQAMQRLTNPAREVLVATTHDQVVGVLILDLNGVLNGYVQILGVHPEWRNRGVGKQLIMWAENRIYRQSPNVFLCVSSFNAGAQRFYTRLGYQPIGELPDFLKQGCSEILMRKTRGVWLDFKPDAA
jgi:ribosomal-protein-alanine N-acetyltransferase